VRLAAFLSLAHPQTSPSGHVSLLITACASLASFLTPLASPHCLCGSYPRHLSARLPMFLASHCSASLVPLSGYVTHTTSASLQAHLRSPSSHPRQPASSVEQATVGRKIVGVGSSTYARFGMTTASVLLAPREQYLNPSSPVSQTRTLHCTSTLAVLVAIRVALPIRSWMILWDHLLLAEVENHYSRPLGYWRRVCKYPDSGTQSSLKQDALLGCP